MQHPGRLHPAIKTTLRLAVGLSLLAWLVARVDPAQYAGFIEGGDGGRLVLGMGLLFLAFPVLQSLRLHVLVGRYSGSLANSTAVFVVGSFFDSFLPSSVGGDAVRLLYLRRLHASNWAGPFAMLVLHRATGIGVLLLAAAVHAMVEHERLWVASEQLRGQLRWTPAMTLAVALGAGGLAILVSLSLRRGSRLAMRLSRFAGECREAIGEVGVGSLLVVIALTMALHFARMLGFDVLVAYTGESIALLDTLPALALMAIAGIVPVTVGGLGLMEGAVAVALSLFGVSPPAAIVVALASRAVLLISAALGGLIYLLTGGPALRSSLPDA